jgi:hypothetical protein
MRIASNSNVSAFGSDESAGAGDDWPRAQKIVLKVADELSSGAENIAFTLSEMKHL